MQNSGFDCVQKGERSRNRHVGTVKVGQPAVPAQLAHDDTQGPCPIEKVGKQPKKND
jgi:hypothetical protein